MNTRWKPTLVEWGFVTFLLVLCAILTVLQYRWTGIGVSDVAAFMRLAMVIVAAAFFMWLMSLWIGGSSRGFRTKVPD